jgi:cytochrome c-type biogenesis protein CcmH
MISRRDFLVRATGGLGAVLAGKSAFAQQAKGDTGVVRDSTNLFAMDQMAMRPVRLPPKPNATPLLTDLQRDELEHHIRCQCGCTLDVFTCRTTDFSCQVSPAMHRDVIGLIKGGYSAPEIMDAFVAVYGERVLMAPRKAGFNLLAWFAPGTAVVIGAAAVGVMLKRWQERARERTAKLPLTPRYTPDIEATPEELARLEAAVRAEDRA